MVRPFVRHLPAVVFFCLSTAVMVFPVLQNLGGGTAGWEGDNLHSIRQMWWVKHALIDLHISPFFDPSSYYPAGHPTANGTLIPATTFLGMPLTVIWGPVVAYNVMLLFSFVMTGLGTYFWVARLTSSRAAGLVAGTVAAFLPYRFAHLPGHLHMMTTQWIPWCLYAFERFRDSKRLTWGLALGLTGALVALSSWYYAYSAALLLPVYAVARTRPWREYWRNPAVWRGLAAAGLVCLIIVAPFLLPYARLLLQGGLDQGLGQMESWSLNFYDFFLPNRLHPLWGEQVARWFPQQGAQWVERGVALGYVAAALAVLGLAVRGSASGSRRRALVALVVVWLLSYAIALGPTLHSGDRQIQLPVPLPVSHLLDRALSVFPSLTAVRAELSEHQTTIVPLPSAFLFLFVPVTSAMRVMARFGMWTGLMTAALAGWGTLVLVRGAHARFGNGRFIRPSAVGAVVVVVLFESWSVVTTLPITPRPVDLWLARQPTQKVIVELPVQQALRPFQDYYRTVHQQATVFGPAGDAFHTAARVERIQALEDFPSAASVEALRSWSVDYVLFTPSEIPGWPAFRQSVDVTPGLRFNRTVGNVWIYGLE